MSRHGPTPFREGRTSEPHAALMPLETARPARSETLGQHRRRPAEDLVPVAAVARQEGCAGVPLRRSHYQRLYGVQHLKVRLVFALEKSHFPARTSGLSCLGPGPSSFGDGQAAGQFSLPLVLEHPQLLADRFQHAICDSAFVAVFPGRCALLVQHGNGLHRALDVLSKLHEHPGPIQRRLLYRPLRHGVLEFLYACSCCGCFSAGTCPPFRGAAGLRLGMAPPAPVPSASCAPRCGFPAGTIRRAPPCRVLRPAFARDTAPPAHWLPSPMIRQASDSSAATSCSVYALSEPVCPKVCPN